jgi:hypothetical protein
MNTPIRQTCNTAMISLIFGILSWVLLPFIGAVIAIISGHMARSEIRRSQGALDGDGLAVGGLVLGYLHLAVILLFLVAVFLFLGGLAFFVALAHHTGHV